MREQIVALENHADLLPQFRQILVIFADGLSFQRYAAALDLLQRIDAAQQRTFAAAAGAQDHDDLALVHIQAQIIQYRILPVFFRQMLYFQ